MMMMMRGDRGIGKAERKVGDDEEDWRYIFFAGGWLLG